MSKEPVVNIRISADFVVTKEQHKKIHGKYTSLTDVTGGYITEGELYHIGYELEDGTDCEEDGTPII
jgi:hypothetical protein